ncbi:MAG: dienelactone hydrolase family protein [Pseudomonadota bacterium]
MAIQTRVVEYSVDGTVFEGYLAWDDAVSETRPGVLVSHTIRGRTPFEEAKARDLAELGYVALALDVYGKDQIGHEERGRTNMDALKADRPGLQARLKTALDTLALQPEVDSECLGAIGFCFGGLCVLDLVRIEAPVRGVASFHGLFDPPGNTDGNQSSAAVLALHGWDDPLAKPASVVALGQELTELGCDWQIHAYGHTMHAFTNPAADDAERGTVYAEAANRRSWYAMTSFFTEIFG